MKVAVIQFPGTNCERETAYALRKCRLPADIIRWNKNEGLEKYDGYVLPGGWSYEDRIRAGIIAARDPIMQVIKEQAALGKPVLGICNGCQMLVENGLVPGWKKEVQLGVAPNINQAMPGFYCRWVLVRVNSRKTAFTSQLRKMIIPMPIAHAEGRFVSKEKGLFERLGKQLVFQYCNRVGEIDETVNGSALGAAGICNPEGNVLAMMPHPERATFGFQLGRPGLLPASKIFVSMRKYIEGRG
ncbi:MAG: phosphoribosylformylglycinamidine synthase I [Nanoarchaeota archaeon]|nr:phosphoribosylformylglycinamidine synthase I [Nanoarchaeota archaeon]